MFITPLDTSATASSTVARPDASTDPAAAQDRFLKLLVAQLNNQDPMNPLDNAQMTSQMAQINTVTGIQQLNQTVKGLADQFAALQMLQGASMVGRSVLTEGDRLQIEGNTASGRFDLAAAATSAKVEVLTPAGQVVGTVDLGSKAAGRHAFEWDASRYSGDRSALRFRVVAANGQTAVASTPLAQFKVLSASSEAGALTLNLENGRTVRHADVKAVL